MPSCVPSSASSYTVVCSSTVTSQQYSPGSTRLRPVVVHVTSNVPSSVTVFQLLQTGVSNGLLLGSLTTAVTLTVPSIPDTALIVTVSLGLITGMV